MSNSVQKFHPAEFSTPALARRSCLTAFKKFNPAEFSTPALPRHSSLTAFKNSIQLSSHSSSRQTFKCTSVQKIQFSWVFHSSSPKPFKSNCVQKFHPAEFSTPALARHSSLIAFICLRSVVGLNTLTLLLYVSLYYWTYSPTLNVLYTSLSASIAPLLHISF